ncbi:MAG: BatA and WFA domain-containing protein [Bacillota bacterium]|nr:BatA and WFA domain-containing protein [Bacillota bacterium]
MRFFTPSALWFLLLVPVLIFFYILKQRFEEKEVSSLYLWQQVLMDSEATSPFQKLRKSILFFLQLLLIILLTMALTNPFLWWKDKNYENLVLVMDTSGSMSALGTKDTKLEEAKTKAEAIIDNLPRGSKITVISSAKNCRVEVAGTSDKKEAAAKIKSLEPSNSSGNLEDSYSLVKSICSQYESYEAVFITDKAVDIKDLNGEVVIMPSQKNNVSLDYMSYTRSDSGLKVLVRAANHGTEKVDAEICLYGDDKLITLGDTAIGSGETNTIYFDKVDGSVKYLKAEISQKDALLADNTVYTIVKQQEQRKILLSTEKNAFLEKVLSAMKDVEVYKTVPGEKIDDKFDLYIYDGTVPGELPKTGSILFINPGGSNPLFNLGGEVQGDKAEVVSNGITRYITNSDFTISRLRNIEVPYWGSALIKVKDNNAAFAGEYKSRKVGALSFDLHNTDFPLTAEFPIFTNSMISYLIDREAVGKESYICGDSIDITALPDAEKITVIDPGKNRFSESSEYPVEPFDKTNTPGIYEIVQKTAKEDVSRLLAVNFPTDESEVPEASGDINNVKSTGKSRGGINLNNILIAAAFLIIVIEWLSYLKLYGSREIKKPKGKGGVSWD